MEEEFSQLPGHLCDKLRVINDEIMWTRVAAREASGKLYDYITP